MGAWGTGITSSDDFMDIYDEIMEGFNNGNKIDGIVNEVVNKYENEFDDEDNSLHNLYFAAAYAGWECGELNKSLFEKVKDIIKTGKDIKCWQELGATTADIKKREKALDAFLEKISTPKVNPKKPKPIKYKPALFDKGDVLSVQLEDGYYTGAVVLENYKSSYKFGINFIVKAHMKEFEKPTITDILYSKVYDYCWYLGVNYKKFIKQIEVIGKVEIKNNYVSGGIGSTFSGWITFVAANNENYYKIKENSDIKNIKNFIKLKPKEIAERQKKSIANSLARIKR